MKKLITIILLFVTLTGWGQTKSPEAWYKFESTNTYEDASGNGYTALPRGNVGYDPIYDAIYFDGNNDYITIPTMDLGTHFAVSFWARSILDVGTTASYFVHMGGSTTFWRTYLYNNQVRIGSTGSNNAYYGKWTKGKFHHIVIEINSTLARIFVDGSRAATQTDSTISATIPSNDSIYVGIGPALSADYYGYIDELMIFKDLTVTSAVLDSLYTKKYLTDPGETYFPVADRHVRLYKNGIEKKDKSGLYFKQKSIPTTPTYLIDLAHDQNFLSYSGAAVNDYVGTIRPNGNWDTISSFGYTIVQDTSELFTLVENNIALRSVTGLQKSKTYTIQYKISDGDYYDYAYASIYIADADSCVLIAPDGSGDYTSWSPVDNAFTSGYYYLQKRGSTINTTYEITINTSNVTIGAYGEGAYPIVNYTPTATTRTFSSTNHEGLLMRDLDIRNYTYDALQVTDFDNAVGQYTELDNMIIRRHRMLGFHRGNNLRVQNCIIHEIMLDGMLIGGVDNIEIANNFIYDVNRYRNYAGVAMSGSSPAYWGDGIQIEPFAASDGYTGYLTNDDAWIHHNYINKNDTNKQIIAYGSYMGTGKLTCEHNRLYGNPDASALTKGFFLSTGDDDNRQDTIIWRYNIMEDVSTAFQYDGARHTELSYNVFRNANNFFNFTGLQDSCIVLNNTFYDIKTGDVFSDPYSGVHIRARNNIFYLPVTSVDIDNTAKGTFSSDNNLYYPNATGRDVTLGGNDIEGDPLFDSNLRLLVGSPCINTGIDLGFDTDLFGNPIVGLPDIGAYEYTSAIEDLSEYNILFADNFNDLPAGAITSNTIVNRWQAIAPNFRENNQSIVDKGSGNKVFRSKYDVGDCSTNQGIELGIMLDTVYKELYMDVNVCYSSGYDTEDAATGTYGGKSPNGGFWGGNHWNVAGTQTPWIIDTIADVHGWSAHNGMGSGANARLFAYIYEIRTWNKQYDFGYSTPNECHIYTRRVKVNDPGQKNAIVATYKDGLLVQQIDTLWFQSVTQLNKNLQFIEGAVIKHSINKCSDENIYVDIDNIVVYRKGVNNPGYLPGPAPIGHTITPLSGTVTTNKFQKPIFFNATRTAASGTIKSHYTGASFHPSKLDGTTYTTVVNNAEGAKKIKFTFWHDGTNNVDAATGMWVKVYSGIGTGGTLLYTWDEAIYTGVPTINQEYSVPTTFTVEFHPSSDLDLGFSLDYYLQ